MSEATFEAATVEAALEAASATMGVATTDLEHEVVEEKVDFWGTGESTVVIKAWEREQVLAATEPEEEAEPPLHTRESAMVEAPAEAAAADVDGIEAFPQPDASESETGAGEQASSDPVAYEEAVHAADETTESMDMGEATEGVSSEPPAAPEAAPAVATQEGAPVAGGDGAPESAAADGEGVEPAAISAMLEQIFHDMEFECTVTVEAEEDGFLATIDGADKEALLEGNGRCLSALELLINNAFRHKLPRGNKVRVDAGDFRNRRDEELSDLALQVAHGAKESGRTQETQPLNPYERRLVHLALAEDPAVTTRSRGSGFLKNVQVIPRGADGGRGRGRRG